MRARVQLTLDNRNIDETVSGPTALDVLNSAKSKVQQAMGLKGLIVAAMSPIGFARTLVKLYNDNHDASYALPDSAEEFLKLGVDLGYVEILPD